MVFKSIGKIFDDYDVQFPLDEQLVIITGYNGTGKTKSLEKLNEYLLENEDCETIMLSEYRTKDFDMQEINVVKTYMSIKGIEYNEEDFMYNDKYYRKGDYINSGTEQFLNMLYYASKCVGGNLLIDFPELNLHIEKQNRLIDILLGFDLKRLVLITHSLSIVGSHADYALKIEQIVQL